MLVNVCYVLLNIKNLSGGGLKKKQKTDGEDARGKLRSGFALLALLSESLLPRVGWCSGAGRKWAGTEKEVARTVFVHYFWAELVHPIISFHWTGKRSQESEIQCSLSSLFILMTTWWPELCSLSSRLSITAKTVQYLKCVLLAQSCPMLCDPLDCSPPGSSVHEIFQARILEWVAISFSRGSSLPRDRKVSCTAGRFFTDRATREALWSVYQSDVCKSHDIVTFYLFKVLY